MALSKDDILNGFEVPQDTPTSGGLIVDPDELRRSMIEEQVREMQRSGVKVPAIGQRAPNPRQEALTGSQTPRIVSLPTGAFETIGEAAGGTGGGMAGAARGALMGSRLGPYGAVAGGLIGGVLGAGAGTAASRNAIQQAEVLAGARPMPTADEAIADTRRAFLEGATAETVGRGIMAVPAAARGLGKRLLAGEIAPEERGIYREAQQLGNLGMIGPQPLGSGVHLTPSTLSEGKSPQLVENTVRRSLSGGGTFKAMDLQNEQNLQRITEQWADATLGRYAGPLEQGQLIQNAIKGKIIPEHKQLVKSLYANLDRQTGNAAIVPSDDIYTELQGIRASLARRGETHADAIATIDDVLEQMSKEGPSTGLTVKTKTEPKTLYIEQPPKVSIDKTVTQESLQSVERGQKPYDKGFVTPEESYLTGIRTKKEFQEVPAGDQLTRLRVKEKSKAPREPIPLTFQQAQDLRSIIGFEIGGPQKPLPAKEIEALRAVYAKMTQNMGEAASRYSQLTGKDINLSWALADTMSKRGKEMFNESIVKKVIERNPEDIVKTVFQKNALSETRDLVRALDTSPETLNLYRRAVVEELLKEATNTSTTRIMGDVLAKKARGRGEEVLRLTFGENYTGFKKILEIAERLPKENNAGLLWFEQGLILAGFTGALSGHAFDSTGTVAASVGVPAAYFLGTKKLASILTDPKKTNELLKLYEMNPKSKAFIRTLTNLGAVGIGEEVHRQNQPQPLVLGELTQQNPMGNLQ